jgi:hypothetical protein
MKTSIGIGNQQFIAFSCHSQTWCQKPVFLNVEKDTYFFVLVSTTNAVNPRWLQLIDGDFDYLARNKIEIPFPGNVKNPGGNLDVADHLDQLKRTITF